MLIYMYVCTFTFLFRQYNCTLEVLLKLEFEGRGSAPQLATRIQSEGALSPTPTACSIVRHRISITTPKPDRQGCLTDLMNHKQYISLKTFQKTISELEVSICPPDICCQTDLTPNIILTLNPNSWPLPRAGIDVQRDK